MQILRTWKRVVLGGMGLALIAAAYVEGEKKNNKFQKDLEDGRTGVLVDVAPSTDERKAVREFVWRKDGKITAATSFNARPAVVECNRPNLDKSVRILRDKLDHPDSRLESDRELDLKASFALVIAGRVVCGLDTFRSLHEIHAYGMRYEFMRPEMSQPTLP